MSVTELIGKEQHDDFLRKNPFSIVFYGSENCHYCQKYKPTFQNTANENAGSRIKFAHVEAEHGGTDKQKTTKVSGTAGYPTTVGYYNSQKTKQFGGADKKTLAETIRQLNNIN
jgi:thiol-disulfide isomerase/thioredoxin